MLLKLVNELKYEVVNRNYDFKGFNYRFVRKILNIYYKLIVLVLGLPTMVYV